MEQSPRGDAFEIIRVVLEAVRDVRRALSYRRWCIPVFGLVRLGEPGYGGIDQGAGAARFRKTLPSKPAVWRTYLLEKEVSRESERERHG